MIKNKNNIVIIFIVIGIIIIGVGYFAIQKHKTAKVNVKENERQTTFDKEFGSYEIPKGWIESQKYSTKSKFFYIQEGHEDEEQLNNISINVGTNRYGKNEHEEFRTAILSQISMQVNGRENVEVNANGSTTENGDVLYEFDIIEENVTTKQYYIVGDYKYILIHETIFDASETNEIDNATKKIINTFKWK